MTKAKDYLARALDAEGQAARVLHPEIKRQFLELARGWRALAARHLYDEPATIPLDEPAITKDGQSH